jgi:hypothetical protein
MRTNSSLLVLAFCASLRLSAQDTTTEFAPGLSAGAGTKVRNLEIFPIRGKSHLTRNYLTLSEAMEMKVVKVHETQEVNELKIENTSKDRFVFIQSGDIVKGGQQDRVLGVDLVLAPKSGKTPIASFCVEQGRWEQRQGEAVAQFSKSDKIVVSKEQRYAVKAAKSQGDVWKGVEKTQGDLNANVPKLASRPASVPVDVTANASPSSLQLALENKEVEKITKEINAGIAKALPDGEDVVGLAYAVNGKLVNAEIYGSAGLFKKLRGKLLDAAAAEAVAEWKDDKANPASVDAGTLKAFLAPEPLQSAKMSKPNKQTQWREAEASRRALYESRDVAFPDVWCHRNVILADETVKAAGSATPQRREPRPQRR